MTIPVTSSDRSDDVKVADAAFDMMRKGMRDRVYDRSAVNLAA